MDKETKVQKLDTIIRHKKDVLEICILMSERLIAEDARNADFSRRLIASAFAHDNSKLIVTLEWNHLTNADESDDMLDIAIKEHAENNNHHPEFWGSIKDMPDLNLCECICDWFARSNELGTDFFEWISKKATVRWQFSKRDKVYKKIMRYANLLVTKSL